MMGVQRKRHFCMKCCGIVFSLVHEQFNTNSSKLDGVITEAKVVTDEEADRFGKKDEEV